MEEDRQKAKQLVCEALRGNDREVVREALKHYKEIRFKIDQDLESYVKEASTILGLNV